MRKLRKFVTLFGLIALSLIACNNKNSNDEQIDETNSENIEKTGDGSNGIVYVNLGLSVMWATTNIGAKSPEKFGKHYAWGETDIKNVYDWSSYKFGNMTALQKYNTNANYGVDDRRTTLEKCDDVAAKVLGGNWRIPTKREWDELRKNCTWSWDTVKGINGWTVTATNGNSIFLPAAGCCGDNIKNGMGKYASYWSSSLDQKNPSGAWQVYFSPEVVGGCYRSRNYGRSVRPVLDLK